MGTATKNYTISKGCIMIALEGEGKESRRDMGNAPGLQLTFTVTKAEHYDSKAGPSQKDGDFVTRLTINGQITCDVPDPENLAIFSMGETEEIVQAAISLATAEDYTAIHDRHISLYVGGETGTQRVVNVDEASVVVKDVTEVTTYTAGTDYVVLGREGLIFIPSTSAIANDDALKITYDAAATTYKKVIGGTQKTIRAWVYFYGNPDTGYIQDLFFFGTLTPSGDLIFISEQDFQTMTFDFEILQNTEVKGLYELDVVGVVDANAA